MEELGLERADEFRTLTKAVELLLPSVLTLFEIGGENSRYVRFERHGNNGQLGIADYRTNGDCAAGTGAFLDQQAGRLRFRVEDLGRIALATTRAAQIAGRCSVFAKSDMIHAQQRGFTPEEILNGLCDAVARNFRGSITRGRSITPDVALVGGVASQRRGRAGPRAGLRLGIREPDRARRPGLVRRRRRRLLGPRDAPSAGSPGSTTPDPLRPVRRTCRRSRAPRPCRWIASCSCATA